VRELRSGTRYAGAVAGVWSAYIGSDAKSAFADWDFAVPDKAVLKEMAKWFDVGMSNAADGTITHTLSTTLIGRDGKVVKFYPGNEWTANDVLGI